MARHYKHVLFAAASLTLLPLTAQAATITFQFDIADFLISTARLGPYASPPLADLSGSAANPVLTVPIGTFIEYGLDAEVTNNAGYGLVSFETGVTNSTGSTTSTARVMPTSTIVNPFFSTNYASGVPDGFGGVGDVPGTAGQYVIAGTTNTAKSTFAANAFANLYNSQRIVPLATSNASFTLSVTNLALALQYVTYVSTTTGSGPYYNNTTFIPGVDTISPLPVLTVNYGVVPEPATLALGTITAAALLPRRRNRRQLDH